MELQSAEVHSADYTWGEPIPESVTLADIRTSIVNGVLSFATVNDFRVALHALAKATDAEYLAWADANTGFSPQYLRYLALVELMESRELPLSDQDLTKADRQFIRIDVEGRPTLRYPSRMYARLLNYQGKVLIDGDLNIFTESYHILIDEADPGKLEIGLATLTTNYALGIIVEPVRSIDEGITQENQKVQQLNFNCPLVANGEVTIFSSRTDNQTYSGSKQELRSDWFLSPFTLTANNTTGELTVSYQMFIDYENWRKQGLIWKRTQPNTLGSYLRDDNSNSLSGYFEDDIRVDRIQQVYSPGTGNITIASTINATVSRHGVFNNAVHDDPFSGGERINGQNGGVYFFDDTELTGFFTPGTGAQRNNIYSMINGTASVRWTDRGNDLRFDPMSTEFNCQ